MNQINTIVKKTAYLIFFISIFKNSLLGNFTQSDIQTSNLIIKENSVAGTIIGQLDSINPDLKNLSYSLKPSFPEGYSPKLWLDASELDWAGTLWNDKSQNSNHATMHGSAHGYPSIKQNAHNGMSLMHYCGAVGSYHSFKEIKDIRTVFWVMRKKMGYSFMLGHDKLVHFHFNTGQFWWDKYASPHVLNGRLSINGNSIDGSNTDIPKDLSIISLRTTGDVTASNFSNDRNIEARFFNGDLGELIIFNETLSDYQSKEVESYLHRKWNLTLAYEPILTPFAISTDGVISSNRTFDHESTPKLPIQILVTNDSNLSIDLLLDVTISDVVHDLDEDGVIDSADSDRDGDGMSNAQELANFSDPDDPTSINHAPTDLNSTTTLTIIENRPANTVVAKFSATDQESPSNLRFALTGGQGDTGNALFSLDTNGTLRALNPFDFENNATQYSIRVAVFDEQNASMESSFKIDLLDEDTFSPISLNRNLMLWLDASDRATLDRGTYLGELGPPEDGNATLFWADKSGKEYHAKSIEGAATYKPEEIYGKPTLYFQNNTFEVLNSSEDFDAWDKMTVLLVLEQKSRFAWQAWIGKWSQVNHASDSSWHFLGRRPDTSPPMYSFRVNGTSANDRIELNNNQTPKLFNPSLLTLSFGNNQRKVFLNGTSALTAEDNGTILSTSFPVTIGGEADKGGSIRMNFSEIIIFNDALDDTERQRVEGYLAHKWNLVQELDDYHPYKNGGIMDGTTITISEELPLGTPILQLSEIDSDYNASWSYSLTEANDSNDNAEFTFFDQSSFDHSSTEGLSLWLDASDISTITADQNGNVSQWADKSSNEYNATAVSGQFPVSGSQSLNGKNVLAWSSNKKMTSNVPSNANWQDCYLVARWSGGSTFPSYNSLFTGKNESSFHGQIHSNKFSWGGWVDEMYLNTKLTKASDSVIEEISQPFIISFSSKVEVSANGYVLGADRNINHRSWVGEIAEVLSFDRSLNSLEKQSIEAYLANKWGLVDQLPELHVARKDILLTRTVLDYETNASTYKISVRATANGSVQNEKEYKILLSNAFEDLDGDGIEDHYDLDDDGDGFSDAEEIAYPSGPRDPDSHANVAPNELNASGSLTISEDAQTGSLVTTLTASDPDEDQNFTYDIAKSVEQLGPVLWLDANHPSASSAVWEDKSMYQRDAIRYHSPTIVENVQNGLPVMRYETNETTPDYHEWDSINNIRTVVAVLKRDSGSILTNSDGYHFWSASTKILHLGNAHVYLREGISRLNGLALDATVTDSPNSQFFLLTFVPTGNVSASRIGKDRSQTNLNYHFDGDYGELLLFDQPLEGVDLFSVEQYLAHKWGLMGNLDSTHPYKDANHTSVADHLSIDDNGTLRLARPLDYETDANYSILALVTDPYGYSYHKTFTLNVTDVFEDLDGDNTADHLDADIDGDGLGNADELLGKSDPYDENSTNRPPESIHSSNLSFTENLKPGTIIGEFNANDPEGNETLAYFIVEAKSLPKPSNAFLKGNLLVHFPFDETNGSIASNFGNKGSDAILLNGAGFVTNEKKFGRSALYLPWNMQQAQARIEKPVELGKDNQSDLFSISVWFKGLYSDQSKWRTLTRGKSLNHHVIIQQGAYNLGVHRNSGGGFIDSGYKLTPFASASNWQHLVAAMDGEKTNFYLDGSYISQSDRSPGHNIYTIGNQSGGGQLFAKYLDDFRIYGKTLSAHEVTTLYGNGNGDYSPFELDSNGTLKTNAPLNYETDDHNYSLTVRALDNYGAYSEQNFTLQLTNKLEDADGNGIEDYESNQSTIPHDIVITNSPLRVSENAAIGSVVGQVKAVDLDGDAHHKYILSTSADPKRFHSSSVDGLTAWFDASDLKTISTYEGTSKIYSWRNKVDTTSILRANQGREPNANATINGLNAISFQKNDGRMEMFKGWKDSQGWNPAGENGKTNGTNDDTAIFLIHQSKVSKRSNMPFGFGWGGHFLWNESITFDPERITTDGVQVGKTHLIAIYNSKTTNQRGIWVDGNLRVSGVPISRNITGAFYFPDNSNESQDYASDCLLGEMLVVRGVMQQEEHLRIEGYLAHKWGLASSLPNYHLYSRNYQSFDQSDVFLSIDNNGTLRTTTTFNHEVDSNLSITIRVIDDEGLSFDKNFSVEITNVAEADLDGDGVEDLLDDDWDGDGVSNWNESQYNSDPMDHNSKNRSPTNIVASSLSFKENSPSGTNIVNFSTSDPDVNQNHSYQLVSDGKTGWRTAHLTGDQDAGIDSSRSYTCAVNVNGADQVINGITFKGEAGLSGTGWEITSGFQSKHESQHSTVNGQVGKVLSNGMRFGGNLQKIKVTGLTVGKKYVFTLYSQAWGTETAREALITNSDSLRHLTVNQNAYTSSSNDGTSVECTYIASSTTTEFTISPMTSSTWHLYAFSNYETSSLFTLSQNGHLSVDKVFDYETDEQSYPLTVTVTDDHNISLTKAITLSLQNEIEDLDGDLVENHEDPDIDGDGVSNANELVFGTDPWDEQSVNEPPSGLQVVKKLQVQENQPVGSLVGKIQGLDPQGSNTLNYSLIPQYPEQIKPVLWLDATDSSTFEHDQGGAVKRWKNKIGSRHDFTQNIPENRPSLLNHSLNNNNSVYFDGDDFMHSLGVINLGDNFSILMVAKLEEVDTAGDALFSYNSNCEGGYFNFRSHKQDGFYGHYFSNETTGNNKVFFAKSQVGPALYELVFDLKQNFVQCFLNGADKGKANYSNAPGAHHIFRLFANLDISQHPTGSIGETLIFNSALPTGQRKKIESYLATKWNLTVDNKILHHFFEIHNDGSIYTTKQFDYEKNKNVSIKIRARDDYNMSIEKEFLISIENIIEDRDGDGIEDAYDFDFDNDGIVDEIDLDDDNDGITDLNEIIWGTDPFNQFSHAQVPIVRTLGYEGNTTSGYALLGEIITNGGAPIIDLGILLSYDIKFNNIEPISAIERDGKKFKLLIKNFRYGSILYYEAYGKNGVGLSNGGIKKIMIPQGKENIELWTQAQKLTGGWRTSTWFGSFRPYSNGWLYHADLGWLYSHTGKSMDLWLWNEQLGWHWTAQGVYPHLFQHSSVNWLYFITKKNGRPFFYNYSTRKLN